ncbi:MAG: hypothetical protein M1814_001143 [Vezdaea aestivalis]|nr:MAG: hypothetical protein M1814_001143 [Vezdaea aestivalis]
MFSKPSNDCSEIPKFTSFRPKPPEPSKAPVKKRRPRRSPPAQEEAEIVSHESKQVDDLASGFIVDKVGDLKNVEYGSVHSYSVPLHRLSGGGAVLGRETRFKAERQVSNGRRDLLFRSQEQVLEVITPDRSEARVNNEAELNSDFISLKSSRGRKRKRPGEYRGFWAAGTSSQGSENDESTDRRPDELGSENENQLPDSDPAQLALKRNAELAAIVDQNQSDVGAWIDLINYQDLMASRGSRKITNAERRSTADIKLSMYEKAATKIEKNHPGRPGLLLGMMKEGEMLWDAKKVEERWKFLLGGNPETLELWEKYIDFRQSDASTFEYNDIRSMFVDCITLSRTTLYQSMRQKQDIQQPLFITLYLILRSTRFMQDCGYSENAIAVWKALLHFNCIMRHSGPPGDQKALSDLGEFWDSEQARIGDLSETPKVDPSPLPIDPVEPFTSWAVAEAEADRNNLPARTTDDVMEDDPYRVILFSDIEDWMVQLNVDNELEAMALLNGFLLFCGLPPMPSDQQWQDYYRDPFLRPIGPKTFEASSKSPFAFQLPAFANSPRTSMGDGEKWFSQWTSALPLADWKYETLRKLFDADFGGETFGSYFLALESVIHPNKSRSTAKAAIKHHPTSLRLYALHAMQTCRQKGIAEGSKVFEAVLGVASSKTELNSSGVLVQSWVEELLLLGDYRAAAERISIYFSGASAELMASIQAKVSSTVPSCFSASASSTVSFLLYAVESQSTDSSQVQSLAPIDEIVAHASLALYREYLTPTSSSPNLAKALEAFTTISKLFASESTLEPFHQTLALLLHHHIQSQPSYKPSTIRSALSYSSNLFPQNPLFQSLLALHSNSFEDRLRDAVQSALASEGLTPFQPKSGLITSTFTIHRELTRPVPSHTAVHAAFERALHADVGPARRSVGVWVAYVRLLMNERVATRTREVFFRALRAVPWAKRVYMLAFEMGEVLDRREMEGVWRLMGDKQLRLRVDLEDVLEDG